MEADPQLKELHRIEKSILAEEILCNFLSLVYFPKTADIFLLLVSNFHIQRGSLNTHIGVSHFVFKLVNVSLNFAHGAQESPASYS